MTEQSTKFNIGDLVGIGSPSNPIIGVVVGVKKFYSGRRFGGVIHPTARTKIEANPNPRVLEIRFNKYKMDQFFEEECHKLTEKEIFKGKLAGTFDKIMGG